MWPQDTAGLVSASWQKASGDLPQVYFTGLDQVPEAGCLGLGSMVLVPSALGLGEGT